MADPVDNPARLAGDSRESSTYSQAAGEMSGRFNAEQLLP